MAEVAADLGWSESKLSRIETAHTGVRSKDLELLLERYQAEPDVRARIRALVVRSRQRGWWEAYGDILPDAYETYIGFEAEATGIFSYDAQLVPGLLQTDEYAAAVTAAVDVYDDPGAVGQRVAVRMARQAVLTRDPPPRMHTVIDEAVLHRPIGGPDVMRRQLLRLVEASERPVVTLQVLPLAIGAHRGLDGSFTILEFAGGSDHPLVYCDGMTGGVFRSKPEVLRSYWMSFEALRSAALSPADSVALIGDLARGDG